MVIEYQALFAKGLYNGGGGFEGMSIGLEVNNMAFHKTRFLSDIIDLYDPEKENNQKEGDKGKGG